jgi:DNA repair protein RecN (Recombination protein N)
LTRICKKYGGSIESALDFLEKCREEREELAEADRRITKLQKEVEEKLEEAKRLAKELGEKRRKVAVDLTRKIEAELAELGMKGSRFEVRFTKIDKEEELSQSGAETAEFFLSPNVGEELKPLIKIASGGELSRIMLAIKSVIHGGGDVPTLVFDEIDAGIGGSSAEVVGRKMRKLAKTSQVLCVTHLPQIASFAHHHKSVSKLVKGSRTVTRVSGLSKDEKINELARMLAGTAMTESAIRTAREMLERGKKGDD